MRIGRWLLVAVVTILWIGTTAARVRDWQDERRLWAAAVQHAPRKPRPQVNRGRALALDGDPVGAARAYAAAIRLARQPDRPSDERRASTAIALVNLALLRWQAGDTNTARILVSQAHDLVPYDPVVGATYAWMRASD